MASTEVMKGGLQLATSLNQSGDDGGTMGPTTFPVVLCRCFGVWPGPDAFIAHVGSAGQTTHSHGSQMLLE
eukprot:1709485-Pyramimonas_sp.AAC.1